MPTQPEQELEDKLVAQLANLGYDSQKLEKQNSKKGLLQQMFV